MSRTSRNFVVAYILLVGLPLLGLAGVLRSGRNLAAPISVDGTWTVQGVTKTLGGHACAALLSSSALSISQSGKILTFSLGTARPAFSGTIEGRDLKASLPMGDSAHAGCAGNQVLVLTAVVDPKSDPRSLTGTLSIDGCPSCLPVEFRALRQPRKQEGMAR